MSTSNDDVDVWIEGDLIKVRMKEAGGSITGTALSPKMWPDSGWHNTQFNFNCDKGGFKTIALDFGITKQFVDGRTLPMLDIRYSNFEFRGPSFRVDVQSDDWGIQAGGFLLNTFKDAYIFTMTPILNLGFPSMANFAMQMIQNQQRGNVDGGIIQAVVDSLPENTIHLPGSIQINYEMDDNDRARIDNGRLIGYFKGEIMGMPQD